MLHKKKVLFLFKVKHFYATVMFEFWTDYSGADHFTQVMGDSVGHSSEIICLLWHRRHGFGDTELPEPTPVILRTGC